MAGAIVFASQRPAPDALWTPVAGRPLLAWSVAACEQTPGIVETLLVVPENRLADAQALVASEGWVRVHALTGGPRVRDAVEAGLCALDPSLAWVVIHDAARPLALPTLIAAALDLAQQSDCDVITGEPVKETVKRLLDGLVAETLPRERMVRVHTPYVFRREHLLAAHAALQPADDFPDEATLAVAAGLPLRIIPGAPDNVRVNSAADVAVVAALLAARQAPS
jgi:2-C-methyl-D-erythritol 4-phosphate cytidylyltransferase